jgi:enoyl-CoA hydratase/carnithine racemase
MSTLLVERHEPGVLRLTLARPERGNALDAALAEALLQQVQAACDDATLHTLVLAGQGRHFCTGLDLSDLETTSDGELLWRLVRIETLLSTLWHAPLRTVAVAHGRTWGAGADLFAACEERVALGDATFRFSGARFGIVLGTRRLAERIGRDAARSVVIEGRELDASAALALGLAKATAERSAAPVVGGATARAIRGATQRAAGGPEQDDADMADLVRSAARPGLRERIAAYRASLQRPA